MRSPRFRQRPASSLEARYLGDVATGCTFDYGNKKDLAMSNTYWFVWLMLMGSLAACGESTSAEEQAATDVVANDSMPQPAPSDQDLLAYARSQKQAEKEPPKPTPTLLPEGDYLPLTWEQLADVKFKEKYYEDVDEWLWFPSFGPQVQAKTGKPVYISGYVIPVQPGYYVLSKNSFESCFFCGGAGPESVMELELVDPKQMFANDEYRTFKGTLRVNDSDIDHLNYILEGAEVVGE
jgi:hypothetical protein